jgi:hypothetical protein
MRSTLKIEVLAPLVLRRAGGITQCVRPKDVLDLPEAEAKKLLDRASGRVRVSHAESPASGPSVGQTVTWESPLFTPKSATVEEALPQGLQVMHPLTGVSIVIPWNWVRRSD